MIRDLIEDRNNIFSLYIDASERSVRLQEELDMARQGNTKLRSEMEGLKARLKTTQERVADQSAMINELTAHKDRLEEKLNGPRKQEDFSARIEKLEDSAELWTMLRPMFDKLSKRVMELENKNDE